MNRPPASAPAEAGLPMKSLLALGLGALLLQLVAYANHFGNGFHFDDSHAVVGNPWIRDLGNVPRFFSDATLFSSLPQNQSYRPLLLTSFAIDYRIAGGLEPSQFQRTTYLFFVLQCILLFFLYRRLLAALPAPLPDVLALFGATLYGVHTVMAETVNYVSARSDVLSTCLVVAALLLFVAWPRGRPWGVYLVPYVLAGLTKEAALVFPALVFLFVLLIEESPLGRRGWTRAATASIPSFAVTLLLAWNYARHTVPTMTPGETPRWNYLITQPWVIARYVKEFVLPTGLSADTDLTPFAAIWEPRAFAGVLALGLLLAAGFAAARRERTRPVAFGLAFFLVALAPTSSLVPLAEVTNDHRMYFPFVGLILAAVGLAGVGLVGADGLVPWRRLRIAAAAGLALLLLHVLGTRARNEVWRSDEALWKDTVAKSPKNGRALMNYGLTLMARGDVDGALALFERALPLTPNYSYLQTNLGIAKHTKGDAAGAEPFFQRGVALARNTAEPFFFYGRFLPAERRPAEAEAQLRRALEISPGHIEANQLLGKILAEKGRKPRPSTPEEWLDLSLAEYRARRFEDSLGAAREALKLRSGYAEAWNNVCSASAELGRWDDAIAACREALRIRPAFPLAANNLRWAQDGKARSLKDATRGR